MTAETAGSHAHKRATHKSPDDSLVIAVSARALFDLEEPNRVFVARGMEAYVRHQREHEDALLSPGPAFHLVKGLLDLNRYEDRRRLVDVVVLSSNHPDTGLRILNSIRHWGLDVQRAAFTGGAEVVPYLAAFDVDLLLSRSEKDVQHAVDGGVAAALMYAPPSGFDPDTDQIRIAFDGDAVVFSEDSELIYKDKGLVAFMENERVKSREPMTAGPFAKFLRTLQSIQVASGDGRRPFRLAMVTARGGAAQERVIWTLRAWGIDLDEVFFLGGLRKEKVLSAFRPHIFFDDQDVHVGPASKLVPSGKVPYRSGSPIREVLAKGADAEGVGAG